MSNRFHRAFATGIPNPTLTVPPVKVDLDVSILPMDIGNLGDMFGVINQQLAFLSTVGATKLAAKIQQFIPRDSTSLVPLKPEYVRGLQDPNVQTTIIQIAFNRAFGETFAARFDVVKMFLALAYGESRLKSGAVGLNGLYTGLLQFDAPTLKASGDLGVELIKQSRVLSLTQSYLKSTYKDRLDSVQVIANIGRIFALLNRVGEQWRWDGSGWKPQAAISSNPTVIHIQKTYPKILSSYSLGRMMLVTVYHTNGLSALLNGRPFDLDHPDRLFQDVLEYYHLGRVPGLTKAIFVKLPGNLGGLFKEIGDIPNISDFDNSTIHINTWWKAIIPFKWHEFAKGNGVKNSDFGWRDRIWDKKRQKWIPAHNHDGEDYLAVVGQPVFALFDGEVTTQESKTGYGKQMFVYNRVLGLKQRVAHLSEMLIDQTTPRTTVKKGDILGLSGDTGTVEGPHLHVEVLNASTGKALPPSKWPESGKHAVNKTAS